MMLKQVLPDVDTSRFLSGDVNYIKNVLFSFIDSVKLEKKHILKEAVKIAETYGLRRTEVSLSLSLSLNTHTHTHTRAALIYSVISC